MYILGISCFYHDASAFLIKDGFPAAGAEEERFTRKKHDTSFPVNAINYCLKEAGISPDELSYVAFYEKPLLKFERVISQHIEEFPKSWATFCTSIPSWLTEKLRVESIIRKKLRYKGKIFFIEHHLCHAASSFFVSPFRSAAILTEDGVGEWATTCIGKGKENKISLEKEIVFPHSLGLLYSAATAHLGFKVNNDEYKVMGLSAYGTPKYCNNFKKIMDVKEDGSFFLDISYFDYTFGKRMPGKKYIREFGPIRNSGEPITKRHKDIAASLQKVIEETVFKILSNLRKETGEENLCIAGGVALNSVANGRILKKTGFKRIFIQPAAGDDGASLGAAYYTWNSILKNKREYVQKSSSFGPSFSDFEIKKFLDGNRIKYSAYKDEKALIRDASGRIKKGNVVGWFQGRMEWGPRALGNRSILANPMLKDMKRILNSKVKHREEFRPFAPVIPAELASGYFECDNPIPFPSDFMLMVYPIRKEKRKLIPSVAHIDGTGRLQTIRRVQNPLYYDLIVAFGRSSGVPILINTSFNIRGEPIVCTPKDAYKCMMGTGIDCLIIGKFLVERNRNLRDAWNSEAVSRNE
jgi:carbamoyltransferase